MMNKKLQNILKIAVSISLIGWMLYKADTKAMLSVVANADPLFCAAVLLSFIIINITQVIRWYALLKGKVEGVGFKSLLKFHMISIFFQSFLPSSFSVDVVKGFLLSKLTDKSKAYGSVAFARFIGMIVLFMFMAVILILQPDLVMGQLYSRELIVALFAVCGLSLVIFSKKVSRFIFSRFPKFSASSIFKKSKQFREDIYAYRKEPMIVIKTVIYSTIIHLCTIGTAYFSYQAINVDVPFSVLLVVSPIVYAALLLPISINGIGAREGLFLLLLAPWGINIENILASSLICYVSVYALCLLGGVVYFLSNVKGIQSDKKEETGIGSAG
ncbi:MAG: flippase-like domain-containing protein [Fibrobacteres bacterium]|nr:flippase-like domain-containing protein [Fibrobacterota bacterium]